MHDFTNIFNPTSPVSIIRMLTTFKNRPVTSRMKMNASNLKHHIFNVSQLPAPRWGAGGRGEA